MISMRPLLIAAVAMRVMSMANGQVVYSNPFQLILRPTIREAGRTSIHALADAATDTLLFQSEKDAIEIFSSLIVAIQDAKFVNGSSTVDPSTVVRLTAVGTTVEGNGTTVRKMLDRLVQRSFIDSSLKAFLTRIKSDPVFGEATTVQIKRVPKEVPPLSQGLGQGIKRWFSNEENWISIAILAILTVLVFLIAYTLIVHCTDKGYFEHLLNRATSQPGPSSSDILASQLASLQPNDVEGSDEEFGRSSIENSKREEEEDTPSTPSTTESIAEDLTMTPTTPERRVRIKTETIASTEPAVSSVAEGDAKGTIFLPGNFDQKWHHPRKTKPRFRKYIEPVKFIVDDEDVDHIYEDNSDNSDDVFHIDVDGSNCSVDDANKSIATAASEVTQWMKTLVVTTGDPNQNMEGLALTAIAPDGTLLEDAESSSSEDSSPSNHMSLSSSSRASRFSCESQSMGTISLPSGFFREEESQCGEESQDASSLRSLEHSMASSHADQTQRLNVKSKVSRKTEEV